MSISEFLECDVYYCNSQSGGKCWAIPNSTTKTVFTFAGKKDRFFAGRIVTVYPLSKPKSSVSEIARKQSKGYAYTGKAWISYKTGEVKTTPPTEPELPMEPTKKEVEPTYVFLKPSAFAF